MAAAEQRDPDSGVLIMQAAAVSIERDGGCLRIGHIHQKGESAKADDKRKGSKTPKTMLTV